MGKSNRPNQVMNHLLIEAIRILRHSHQSVRNIFTDGACYEFYKFLKILYPQAEAWYDGNHVFTKIDGAFYDIDGHVSFTEMGERGLRLMTDEDKLFAEEWAMKQYTKDKLHIG